MNHRRRPLNRQEIEDSSASCVETEMDRDNEVTIILEDAVNNLLAALRFDPADPTLDEEEDSLDSNIYDYADITDGKYFGLLDNKFKLKDDKVS